MIKYIVEASEKDWTKFHEWCNKEGAEHLRAGVGNVGEKCYNIYRNEIYPKIQKGPEVDLYHWMKHAGYKEFVSFVANYTGTKNDAKKFKDIFGQSTYNRIVKNKSLIPARFANFHQWVMTYQKAIENGEEHDQVVDQIEDYFKREVFDKYHCYTDEELKAIEEGSEIVMKKNGWTVVKIYNYPASEDFGRGSGWCTTGHYNDPNGRGDEDSGERMFDQYMRDHIDTQKDAKGKYYLMYLNDDGRKYNVLQVDDSYTWVGTKGKDNQTHLPDDVPITPLEVLKMSNPGKNFDERGNEISGGASVNENDIKKLKRSVQVIVPNFDDGPDDMSKDEIRYPLVGYYTDPDNEDEYYVLVVRFYDNNIYVVIENRFDIVYEDVFDSVSDFMSSPDYKKLINGELFYSQEYEDMRNENESYRRKSSRRKIRTFENYLVETGEKDWQIFHDWCIEEGKHNKRVGSGDLGEKAYQAYRNHIFPKVQHPENDPYYWKKQGFRAFVQFVSSYSGSGSDEKKFKKLFGDKTYKRFTQNQDLIPSKYRGCSKWVSTYNKYVAQGQEPNAVVSEISTFLSKIFQENNCYTDEELNQIEEGSEIVMDKDGWKVVKIYNYPASEHYGRGSGWCTTGHYTDHNGRGDAKSGAEQFKNYMSHIDQKDAKGKYYLMYLNKDGRKYNVLRLDDSDTWVGSGGKDSLSHLPKDVPITPQEVYDMSNGKKTESYRRRNRRLRESLDNNTLRKWNDFMQDKIKELGARKLNEYKFVIYNKGVYEYVELNKDGSVSVVDVYGDHDRDEQTFETLDDLLDCFTGGSLDDFDEF